MRPLNNRFFQNLIVLLAVLLGLSWSNSAYAQDDDDEDAGPQDAGQQPQAAGDPVDRFRSICAAFKGHADKSATEEELRDCYDNNLFPKGDLTLEAVCRDLCGPPRVTPSELPVEQKRSGSAPKPAGTSSPPAPKPPAPVPPKPSGPRKLTPEQKCHAQKGVYIQQPDLDANGQPTGAWELVCLQPKDLAWRIIKLEKLVRELPKPGSLTTPEQLPAVQQAELLCPPIPGFPSATSRERCEEELSNLNVQVQIAQSRADAAYGLGERANERIDDLLTGKTRLPPSLGRYPHLLFALSLPMHFRLDFRERFVGGAVLQVRPMIDITPGLQFMLLGGGGVNFDDGAPIAQVGAGLSGPIAKDVLLQASLLAEHRFRREALTYLGPQIGIVWLPDLFGRSGYDPVAGIGFEASGGVSFGKTPAGVHKKYLDGLGAINLFLGF
jgi:hypothetical protein